MKTDLSKVNLNLLIGLSVLLEEQHVTRAAERLNLSQSAMSNILKQLRALFGDELFVRGQASKMLLTPKAKELIKPINEIIAQTSALLFKQDIFDYKTAKHEFVIGMSDYTELVLLPPLVQFLSKNAPNISLNIKHLNYLSGTDLFENDEIDLAIGIYKDVPNDLIKRLLFKDQVVVIGWNKSQMMKKPIDIETFAKAQQLVILYCENRSKLLSEKFIKELGYERRAIATIPHVMAAMHSLPNTDIIATTFGRVAQKFITHLPLAIQKVAFKKCTSCDVEMVWHQKDRNNQAHKWLRDLIITISANLL